MIDSGNDIVDCEDERNNSDYNCAVEKRRLAHKNSNSFRANFTTFFSSLSGQAYYSREVKLFKLLMDEIASKGISKKTRAASMNENRLIDAAPTMWTTTTVAPTRFVGMITFSLLKLRMTAKKRFLLPTSRPH
jgi:hypothetical protein